MIIEKKHFEYLVNQHGRIASAREDFAKWRAAYDASLSGIDASVADSLPKNCGSILDIGSGLGGIDVLLARRYDSAPHVALLDGIETGPEVLWSFVPHNSMTVARDFLAKNGVNDVSCIAHNALDDWKGEPFDLVVSFAAWAFHFDPGELIPDLKKHIHDGTVIICDVRKSKPEWLRKLVEAFGQPKVLERAEKYVRVSFRA